MRLAGVALMIFGLAAVAPAQAWTAGTGPSVWREELQQVQAAHDRLLTTRIRYDLGLPVQGEQYFALSEAERGRGRAPLEQQLVEEQGRVTALGARLLAAEEKLAQVQQQVKQAVAVGAPLDAGPLLSPRVPPSEPEPFTLHEEPPPAAPPAEPSPKAAPADAGGAPPVLLRGSDDHSRVGRALFAAGKFDRARQELAVAVQTTPDLMDLFYLARSCEQLGDHAKADELYLQIESTDTTEVNGQKQPGSWARAARVARRQMQWMQNNAQWQPVRPIDSVPWRSR